MCGIFGYIGKKDTAAQIVFNGLKALEYRGYDSWGVAVIKSKTINHKSKLQLKAKSLQPTIYNQQPNIVVKKKAGKIGSATVSDMPSGNLAIGHTRWATHGGVTDKNAHPHLDCTGQIALVHNGIIENYEDIKNKRLHHKHNLVSETDTEIAVHLIEESSKHRQLAQAVRLCFNKLHGLNAIIAVDNKSRQIVAVRNGSPLVVGYGQGENFLASDASALLPHTQNVYFLRDNEMAIITPNKISIKNAKTYNSITPKKLTLTWAYEQAKLGDYPHFMLKEIHEQPRIVADIAATGSSGARKYAKLIKVSFGSYLLGCGSAAYVGLAGTYLLSKVAKTHINWAIGSEFGYHLDFLTDKSLVIALSQSGETMDTLESIKKAKDKGAKIAAIVNVLGSTLYREADHKLLVNAGPEKAVASTKALTAKLSHLTLIAYALAGDVGIGQHIVKRAVQSTKTLLSPTNISHFKRLAKKYKSAEHIYVIGRGLSYPASLETALKIKEIAYIHAEGMAAGELKHGPLALVESGTPCIAYLPNDETYGANLAGAMEMHARGGHIIGISHKPHEIFANFIKVKEAREATIIPNIVAGQLLAYYLTLERGFDPDKPRNLAKSVTVK